MIELAKSTDQRYVSYAMESEDMQTDFDRDVFLQTLNIGRYDVDEAPLNQDIIDMAFGDFEAIIAEEGSSIVVLLDTHTNQVLGFGHAYIQDGSSEPTMKPLHIRERSNDYVFENILLNSIASHVQSTGYISVSCKVTDSDADEHRYLSHFGFEISHIEEPEEFPLSDEEMAQGMVVRPEILEAEQASIKNVYKLSLAGWNRAFMPPDISP